MSPAIKSDDKIFSQLITQYCLIHLNSATRNGGTTATETTTLQYFHVCGWEPTNLSATTTRLQFTFPPARIGLLSNHNQLASLKGQLLVARSFIWSNDLGHLTLFAAETLKNKDKIKIKVER